MRCAEEDRRRDAPVDRVRASRACEGGGRRLGGRIRRRSLFGSHQLHHVLGPLLAVPLIEAGGFRAALATWAVPFGLVSLGAWLRVARLGWCDDGCTTRLHSRRRDGRTRRAGPPALAAASSSSSLVDGSGAPAPAGAAGDEAASDELRRMPPSVAPAMEQPHRQVESSAMAPKQASC